MSKLKLPPSFKLYLWVFIPLLAIPALASWFFLRQPPKASIARSATAPAPVSSASATPKPAPSASATPKPSPSPSASATPKPAPTLTAEQQELNRKYKESFQASMASADTLIEMHIVIAEGVASAAIGASGNAQLLDQKGNPLHTLPAGTAYTVQPGGDSISFGEWSLPSVVQVQPGPSGVLYLGDRPYRGSFLLVADSGHLWVVNYVNMRDYLYGVVPSEVSPSWSPEALKAQAIAARSYALTHFIKPASSIYHMGATERYQVYSGISREDPRTNQAVDETSGQFVSYRDGIVESLYAASDDIVAEAFQGHGMSQLGALKLAEQGYTHQQILANYYPGTGIGRIQADYE